MKNPNFNIGLLDDNPYTAQLRAIGFNPNTLPLDSHIFNWSDNEKVTEITDTTLCESISNIPIEYDDNVMETDDMFMEVEKEKAMPVSPGYELTPEETAMLCMFMDGDVYGNSSVDPDALEQLLNKVEMGGAVLDTSEPRYDADRERVAENNARINSRENITIEELWGIIQIQEGAIDADPFIIDQALSHFPNTVNLQDYHPYMEPVRSQSQPEEKGLLDQFIDLFKGEPEPINEPPKKGFFDWLESLW